MTGMWIAVVMPTLLLVLVVVNQQRERSAHVKERSAWLNERQDLHNRLIAKNLAEVHWMNQQQVLPTVPPMPRRGPSPAQEAAMEAGDHGTPFRPPGA